VWHALPVARSAPSGEPVVKQEPMGTDLGELPQELQELEVARRIR
jgi:hypothetical protein